MLFWESSTSSCSQRLPRDKQWKNRSKGLGSAEKALNQSSMNLRALDALIGVLAVYVLLGHAHGWFALGGGLAALMLWCIGFELCENRFLRRRAFAQRDIPG